MTYTEFDPTLFETGDMWTETNILNHIGNNILSIPHRLDLQNAAAGRDVVSTAGETSFWAALPGMIVPADSLGVDGSIEVVCFGDLLYNNNAADTLTLRVRFGGATVLTIYGDNLDSITATRRTWWLRVILANRAATNAQVIYPSGLVRTGAGTMDLFQALPATSAVNTTVDQTLDLTAQWSASSANNSFRRYWGQALIAQN